MERRSRLRSSQIENGTRPARAAKAAANAAIFLLKVLPTLPSRPVNWVTPDPIREPVRYPSQDGPVAGEIARPATPGPHPGMVVCLGVVPFGVDHPQVPRLQEALARSGFVTLLYWSPAMRDFRLDPDDIENLSLAYDWLIGQPYVDPERSGILGTCVGGSFALPAAASPRVRDRVHFVAAFAPYASMRSLARDIASATRLRGGQREAWAVDPLSRKVFVHCLTADLKPTEAARLREAMAEPTGQIDPLTLSSAGQTVYPLLTTLTVEEAEAALSRLPATIQERLDTLSPIGYVRELAAPIIVLMHDRDDLVIPQAESLRLRDALSDRAGLRYTEFVMFKHMDPTKVHLHILPLLRELGKFFRAIYPIFRQAAR